jgi:hypothetical protein
LGGLKLEVSSGKKLALPISTNGWTWWYIPIIPALAGSINRMTMIQAGLGKK